MPENLACTKRPTLSDLAIKPKENLYLVQGWQRYVVQSSVAPSPNSI